MSETKKPAAKAAVKKEPTKGEKWAAKSAEKIGKAKDKVSAAALGYDTGYKVGLVAGKKAAMEE
jgi:flagellar biosynthesis/type III secretory pathway protein FliH